VENIEIRLIEEFIPAAALSSLQIQTRTGGQPSEVPPGGVPLQRCRRGAAEEPDIDIGPEGGVDGPRWTRGATQRLSSLPHLTSVATGFYRSDVINGSKTSADRARAMMHKFSVTLASLTDNVGRRAIGIALWRQHFKGDALGMNRAPCATPKNPLVYGHRELLLGRPVGKQMQKSPRPSSARPSIALSGSRVSRPVVYCERFTTGMNHHQLGVEDEVDWSLGVCDPGEGVAVWVCLLGIKLGGDLSIGPLGIESTGTLVVRKVFQARRIELMNVQDPIATVDSKRITSVACNNRRTGTNDQAGGRVAETHSADAKVVHDEVFDALGRRREQQLGHPIGGGGGPVRPWSLAGQDLEPRKLRYTLEISRAPSELRKMATVVNMANAFSVQHYRGLSVARWDQRFPGSDRPIVDGSALHVKRAQRCPWVQRYPGSDRPMRFRFSVTGGSALPNDHTLTANACPTRTARMSIPSSKEEKYRRGGTCLNVYVYWFSVTQKTNSVCILSQSTYWLREENKLSIGVPAHLRQLASSDKQCSDSDGWDGWGARHRGAFFPWFRVLAMIDWSCL
ncbi:hypothetical protein THAOC_26796, partial [Thalassiosira oceanica]